MIELFGLKYLSPIIIILIQLATFQLQQLGKQCNIYFDPVYFYLTGDDNKAKGFYSTEKNYLYEKIKYLENEELKFYVGRHYRNNDTSCINIALFRNFDTVTLIKKDSIKLIPFRDTTSVSEYSNYENEIYNIFHEMREEGISWNDILVYKTFQHERGHFEDEVRTLRTNTEDKEREANRIMKENIIKDWKLYKFLKGFKFINLK